MQTRARARSQSSASAVSPLLMDLDDDTLMKIFCHLPPVDLARLQCVSMQCNVLCKWDGLWSAHVTTLSNEYETHESQERVDECTDALASAPSHDAKLIPAHLNPFTISDAKLKAKAEHDAWWERESAERKAGKPREFRPRCTSVPRWRTFEDVTQYRCYAANDELSHGARADAWVAHPFPETTCCGMQLTTPEEFHVHMKSWRHYTFHAAEDAEEPDDFDVDVVYVDIDPRMIDGPDAFSALPKHVAFKRLKRYVDHINEKLERRRNADTWSESDRLNIERIVKYANENFAYREEEQFADTDSGEREIEVTAQDVANIVVGCALETFKSDGPFGEIHGVPYLSVDDLAHVGLIALDPFGGSTSARQFMETLYRG